MMLTGSDALYTVAANVLEEVRQRLASTQSGAPNRYCVVPGAIAWDECDCGTLAVALTRSIVADAFNIDSLQFISATRCGAPYLIGDLILQVIRCAPNPQGSQLSVSCEDLERSAREVTIDAYESFNGVICALTEMVDMNTIDDFALREQVMVGPQGGCVGSEVRFSVSILR